MYTSIIIDDEAPARSRLRRLLKEHDRVIEVVDEAKDGFEAVEKIALLKPQLIFLDIQMPGMSGFEVLDKLEYIPVVIFTTAYDQFALKAFDSNTIDYLLKPIEAERLKMSIDKIGRFINHQSNDQFKLLINAVKQIQDTKEVTSLSVKIGDRIILVRLNEVAYLEAKDKYVTIHTCENKEYITEMSLKTLEEKLPGNFMRVHRSYIVNKTKVLEIQKFFNGKHLILLNDKNFSKIPCSSMYSAQLKDGLEVF